MIRTRTRDEWCRALEGSDVCFAPVLDLNEAPAHPHNRARGTFVEVEGPGESHVMKIREELGLADEPMIKPSYIAMLMEYLRERGLPPEDVRFSAK